MSDRPQLPREIRTPRLLLRPFHFSDVDAVLRYANDAQWAHFLPVPHPYTRADAETFIARSVLRDWNTHPQWAVTLDGAAIGGHNIMFRAQHRVAELGWGIASAHWGKGYGTEAARAIIDTAFKTKPGLGHIQARAHVDNGASRRVMEKIGMTLRATIPLNHVVNDELVDEVFYGILREEWEAGA